MQLNSTIQLLFLLCPGYARQMLFSVILSPLEVSSTVVIIDSILVSIGWRLNKIRGNIGRDSNKGPAGAAVANQGCQQPSSVTLRYYQASSASWTFCLVQHSDSYSVLQISGLWTSQSSTNIVSWSQLHFHPWLPDHRQGVPSTEYCVRCSGAPLRHPAIWRQATKQGSTLYQSYILSQFSLLYFSLCGFLTQVKVWQSDHSVTLWLALFPHQYPVN